eukprot:CAMPEP_0181317312 /NCGR_PEP_ID=MMETSP1101-20121128/16401_1 /TAXON_ID=46948 /ORGANISM="Rhodomonas abbreviata, Strain Caron Lab Isolate" /LENGTH=69 /DNA_ID=CAMNT_0023424697 /DNA_START=539 /DNA_END=748 /DNA_ORIENTATION=-
MTELAGRWRMEGPGTSIRRGVPSVATPLLLGLRKAAVQVRVGMGAGVVGSHTRVTQVPWASTAPFQDEV